MNRYMLFLLLINLYANNTLSVISQTAKEGEKLKEQIDTKKNTTAIDKHEIMNTYQREFNWTFSKGNLNKQQKNHFFELLCKCSHEMEDHLGKNFYNSQYEAENAISEQRALCLANVAKIMTAYKYEIDIAKKNLEYDAKTQQNFEKEAYEKTYKDAKRTYTGDVTYLVNGQLEKELEKKIDALPRKPAKKDIYEIYPHEKGPGHQETLNRISSGKHHREDKCPVCLDSYQEIGKRVNLPCGHDICPSCLYSNKYDYKRHTCTICIRDISNDDFPADYLKKHKD